MNLDFESVPESIRHLKQWILWSFKEANGKNSKVPCDIAGNRASLLNPNNHFLFDEAVSILHNHDEFNPRGERFSGIGFVFMENGGYTGIDLDKCVNPETSEIMDWAQKIINDIGSYTEYSVSGTGVHLIVKGTLPGIRNRTGNIEMYDDGRFFVVTGNRLGECPEIMDRQDELTTLYNRVFPDIPKPTRPTSSMSEQPMPNKLSDGQILDLLFSQREGAIWKELYQDGWIEGKPYARGKVYDSLSEVDSAFCFKLAFYSDDAEQIKRIIYSSALGQRDKWTARDDYPDMVIENALALQSNKYTLPAPSTIPESAENVESIMEWPEIVRFEKYKLPVFPTDIFPTWGREYVEAVAESTQTPVDMAAMLFLSTLAVCVQRRFELQIRPGYLEPLCLYVMVIMPPANRKTAVFKEIMKPIRMYEKSQRTGMEDKIAERQAEIETLKAKQGSAISRIKKGDALAQDELQSIKQKLRNTKELFPPSLVKQDITAESLVEALRQNNSQIGVLSDEGGILEVIGGLYTKGKTNIDIFLKGHTGMDYAYDRKGSESALLERVTITLGLTLQNTILNDFLANGTLSGRGLAARCLYSIPETLLGKRKANSPDIPQRIRTAYHDNILNMLKWKSRDEPPAEIKYEDIRELIGNEIEVTEVEDDEPVTTIRFSAEATETFERFFEQHEQRLDQDTGDLNGEIHEWAGKHVGHVMRIAGLLHVAKYADQPDVPLEVDALTVESAICLSEYLIHHAHKAYGKASPGSTIDKQEALLKAILADKNSRFGRYSVTDIWRLVRRHYKKAKDITVVLNELVMRGYLCDELIRRYGVGKDSMYYTVNPKIFEEPVADD